MEQRMQFVAVLTSSPALGSILAMVLDCEEHLNVQTFSCIAALECHMRIAPVDLLVCDHDVEDTTAPRFVAQLRRSNPARSFEAIMLSASMSQELRQACRFAPIEEVIIKPMSPLFVRDRVNSRLRNMQARDENPLTGNSFSLPLGGHMPPAEDEPAGMPDNVVSLFADRNSPQGSRV